MTNELIAQIQSLVPQRVELIHPLTVHFPVALLMTGAALWLLALALTMILPLQTLPNFFRRSSLLMILLGLLAGLVALKTGDIAEDVVNQLICDPELTNRHEEWAQITLAIFAGGLALALLEDLPRFMQRLAHGRRFFFVSSRTLAAMAFIAGIGCLMWTGHLGGKLVYEQGAAVVNAKYEPCPEE